jgi:ATP phosphoribosyltransferase
MASKVKKEEKEIRNMKLKLAIQKSGRLYDSSIQLLKECGIDVAHSKNQLRVVASNFPIEIFFLRDDDIPQYVADNVANLGIVGENVLVESGYKVNTVQPLGFGKCRLSIAVPKKERFEGIKSLEGKKIATSYPNLLKAYLDKNKVEAEIHIISGSVEIAPKIGLADAICDLVSSGSTLFMNELKEAEVIFESQAVLIANENLDEEQKDILKKLLFRIQAVRKASKFKYILMNAPTSEIKNICSLLPGMKSPTVLPLAQEGWSSIHSVVEENDFWNIIEQLKEKGAEGILVIPIEKMIL